MPSTRIDWKRGLKACAGTFAGIGIGAVLGTVADPFSNSLDPIGANLAFLVVGAWCGGTGGCFLSLVRRGWTRALAVALGVFILLPGATGMAVLFSPPVVRTVHGPTGLILGLMLGIGLIAAAPIGANAIVGPSRDPPFSRRPWPRRYRGARHPSLRPRGAGHPGPGGTDLPRRRRTARTAGGGV
jgi:hypothetical protein